MLTGWVDGWGLISLFCVQPNYTVEAVFWLSYVDIGVATIILTYLHILSKFIESEHPKTCKSHSIFKEINLRLKSNLTELK